MKGEGVVLRESYTLYYVTDHLSMQEMNNEIMYTMPNAFHRNPDRFKTQGMCNKAVEVDPLQLKGVPNHFKTQEMCEKAVKKYLWLLKYVPDWFVTQQQLKIQHDVDGYYNDDELIGWYEGY